MTSVNSWRLTAVVALMIAGYLAGATQASADPPAPVPGEHVANGLCLACHEQNLTVDYAPIGRRLIDAVRGWAFATSVHNKMDCVECHTGQDAIPHANADIAADAGGGVNCAGCHADADEGYREGPHGPVAELGDARAPACTNCHGNAHYIQPVDEWEEQDRVAACTRCHAGAGPGFLGASPGHRSPSAGFLSTPYFAGLFLMILTAATLAFGIVHVELEMLRWLAARLADRRGTNSAKGARHDNPG